MNRVRVFCLVAIRAHSLLDRGFGYTVRQACGTKVRRYDVRAVMMQPSRGTHRGWGVGGVATNAGALGLLELQTNYLEIWMAVPVPRLIGWSLAETNIIDLHFLIYS